MRAARNDDHRSSRAVPEWYRTLAVQGGMEMGAEGRRAKRLAMGVPNHCHGPKGTSGTKSSRGPTTSRRVSGPFVPFVPLVPFGPWPSLWHPRCSTHSVPRDLRGNRTTGRPAACTAPAGTARHRWRSMLVWSLVIHSRAVGPHPAGCHRSRDEQRDEPGLGSCSIWAHCSVHSSTSVASVPATR